MSASDEVTRPDAGQRRANRRLAIGLGLVAVGFYVLMLLFSPQ